jgi:hypothetical protein
MLRVLQASACLSAVLASGCNQQASRATVSGDVQKDVPTAKAVAKFSDVTQEAGIAFKQASGACGEFYFVEQNAAGASFLDANGDGFLDIYFPQPRR